jgi:glycosyltransferase involved in cell wall biosynthesis
VKPGKIKMDGLQKIDADSRIIFATEIEAFGGAERSILALSSWLYRRSIPHHFLLYLDHVGLQNYSDHPIGIVQLLPEMKMVSKVRSLRRYFREFPARYKPLASGYQPALHLTLAGKRGFHTLMHDTPSLFLGGNSPASVKGKLHLAATTALTGLGLRGGGTTIVTSEFLRDDSKKVFGVEAAIARMGGVGGNQPEFRIRHAEGEFSMLSISRIEANKRLDWLLRALGALESEAAPLSRRLNWQLDLVGKGSQTESLKSLAWGLGIADRVHFHGFVSDEELVALYARANLFFMPALQGYGIPAIESLQRGIPVLLHRESGVSDILRETPWATVFYGGEEALLPAMREAITSAASLAHASAALPQVPTEDEWAERVATLCQWV